MVRFIEAEVHHYIKRKLKQFPNYDNYSNETKSELLAALRETYELDKTEYYRQLELDWDKKRTFANRLCDVINAHQNHHPRVSFLHALISLVKVYLIRDKSRL